MATTGSDFILSALRTEGTSRLFGLIGEGNAHLLDRIQASDLEFTYARHEQVAVTMADAYARLTGTVGVCTLTHGPGVTNGATGIAIADRDNTPLVILVGDSDQEGRETALQYLDHGAFTQPVSVYQTRVETPKSLPGKLNRAFDKARTERGPAVVEMPANIQETPIEGATYEAIARPSQRIRPDPARLAEAGQILTEANSPVILAGGGAAASGAGEVIEKLAERLGTPIATTFNGRGVLPESHPFVSGIVGTFMTPANDALVWDADTVLVLGAHLSGKATRYGALYEDAAIVQVDRDPAVFGTHLTPACMLQADARAAVEALLERVPSNPDRADDIEETIAAAPDPRADSFVTEADRIDPRELTVEISRRLPDDAVVTIDSGNNTGFPALYHPIEEGRMLINGNFGTMGFALPAAIGAQLAAPERVVGCYIGDGGLLMVAQALETAGRLELPLVIVVYNDASYGIIRHRQELEYDRVAASSYEEPDFTAIAGGFGAQTQTVRSVDDLSVVSEYLDDRPAEPLVLDAKTIQNVTRPGFPPY